ncbi:hypothetical protein FXO37_32373 [Capsicum annuum]|nr:hypothetical protein FXO37_32373 [Capsicum annuum]
MSNSTSQDDPARKMQRKHKLILTRPKEPEFVTAQCVRPTRVKSSAELEEEMMTKIPKFKARPLNKKARSSRVVWTETHPATAYGGGEDNMMG